MNGTEWAAKDARTRAIADEFAAAVAPLLLTPQHLVELEPEPGADDLDQLVEAIREDTA